MALLTSSCIILASVISFVNLIGAESKFLTRVVQLGDGAVKAFAYKESAPTANNAKVLCAVYYNNSYPILGWDIFEAQSNPSEQSDADQAQCVGELEGLVTSKATYYHYHNTVEQWCKGRKQTCAKVYKFLDLHLEWIEQSIKDKGERDPVWHHVEVFFKHLIGIHQGYSISQTDPDKNLTLTDFIVMNLHDDLEDVAAALEGDSGAKVRGDTRCSALVKLLPDNQDLLVGHNTWTEYVAMYRMLKKYNLPLRTSAHSTMTVPGATISFSGYPGVITSGDDFYVTSSRLIALETTIGNSNASRWQFVQPTGQLFESVRSLIALRLANNGRSWCETFSGYNSGTYNNQWIIVDLNKFKKGKPPQEGTLWILEQIPGYVRFDDQTPRLRAEGYWPSYNVPYYSDVFNLSGNWQLVQQYGDWFTYDKTPRALIFRRDQGSVVDVGSLLSLLRTNDYQKDPFAKCNCTPPYSAENALAARSDLNPKKGQYPFPALGHRPHGATDAKAVNTALARNLTFLAVCGPTTSHGQLPVFTWSLSDYRHLPHLGQPNSPQFDPIVHRWIGKLF